MFENSFHNASSFSELFEFLVNNNFRLANLDYWGKGSPQSFFVPHGKPFGICSGSEAVFIRNDEFYLALEDQVFIQFVAFLFCNNLHDYAASLMERKSTLNIADSKYLEFVEAKYLLLAKTFETTSIISFEKAISLYSAFFGKDFPGNHMFWRYVNSIR